MPHANQSLPSLKRKLIQHLLATQDSSGGWGEHPGATLSPFNTAEVVLALSAASPVDGAQVQQSIRSAKQYMLTARDRVALPPPDTGAWHRTVRVDSQERRVPDIVRTSICIGAFVNTGESTEEGPLAASVGWLLGRQNKTDADSGWGYQRGEASSVFPTCFALLALMAASRSTPQDPWKDPVEKGLKHLTDKFLHVDGSFGTGLLTAAHTIYACIVLQTARVGSYRIVASAENDAIQWLLKNQDDALSPVEEKITIDPEKAADYPFMFTMEPLLLRALGNAQDASTRDTKLWIDVQRSIRAAFDDETGGFYGRRVFSWSTANGLYAVRSSEQHLKDIPPRPAEDPSSIKVGTIIVVLVALLAGGVVYLAHEGHFTTLVASVLIVLVLAVLLAFGQIREATFKDLVLRLMPGANKNGKDDKGNGSASNDA
jgi:hypothetical protein